MKKSILALGVASAMFCGAASAADGVTLGGLVDLGVFSSKAVGADDRTSGVLSGGLTTSWFGMNGSEDLGGGLTASFKLTGFFKADTGMSGRFSGDPLFSRDAAVSLAGGFGKVTLGRQTDPAFLPVILFNPFGDSFSVSPLVMQTYMGTTGYTSPLARSDSGWSNAVSYSTPSLGGAVATLEYEFGEGNGTGNPNVGANVLYFSGPLALTAYYQKDKLSNPLPALLAAETKTWMVGGSYDFKVVKLFGTYGQSTKDDAVSTKDKTAQIGVSVPLGGGAFLADWARTKQTAATDLTWDTATVGYDYSLSKRTDVYAAAMFDKVTDLSNGNTVAVGIRHRF